MAPPGRGDSWQERRRQTARCLLLGCAVVVAYREYSHAQAWEAVRLHGPAPTEASQQPGRSQPRALADVSSAGSSAAGGGGGGSSPGAGRIPHIIHQTWKTKDVPQQFLGWQETWQYNHPDWEYRLWTDEDNRRLVAEAYPWFLATYDAFPHGIMRADAARAFILHAHGGVYADLDVESLKPLGPLLDPEVGVVLAYMSETWWLRHNIPNAWMASAPGHPFWQFCMAHMLREFRPDMSNGAYYKEGIEKVTGPVALMECYEAFQAHGRGGNITVLDPGLIFPYNWHEVTHCRTPECIRRVQLCGANEKTFDPAACKAQFPEAYAITYWAHTWGEDKDDATATKSLKLTPTEAPTAGASTAEGALDAALGGGAAATAGGAGAAAEQPKQPAGGLLPEGEVHQQAVQAAPQQGDQSTSAESQQVAQAAAQAQQAGNAAGDAQQPEPLVQPQSQQQPQTQQQEAQTLPEAQVQPQQQPQQQPKVHTQTQQQPQQPAAGGASVAAFVADSAAVVKQTQAAGQASGVAVGGSQPQQAGTAAGGAAVGEVPVGVQPLQHAEFIAGATHLSESAAAAVALAAAERAAVAELRQQQLEQQQLGQQQQQR